MTLQLVPTGDQPRDFPLALYEAMISAIVECERVDEIKDIRDKSTALEAYYKQARNMDAEIKAANIRLRAERRAGELLKELARAKMPSPNGRAGNCVNGDDVIKSPYASALSQSGISRQTASQFQKLADIPEDEFEAAMSEPEKPTRSKLLRSGASQTVSDDALWLWGRLKDFERKGYLEKSGLGSMTPEMRDDVKRLAPSVANYLSSVEDLI